MVLAITTVSYGSSSYCAAAEAEMVSAVDVEMDAETVVSAVLAAEITAAG